ncbi:MAG: hypothetical protein A2041_06485 [Bacteroidetes bacterium GWA2_31_9b]|nr:MAG: hypothetical protein A2041_06485 [Bacteroidetes bacterium GWA2_31_9b]
MDKLAIKKEIIKVCAEMLENSIKTVRGTIDEILETASEYEGDHDMFDPFKEEMMKKKDMQVELLKKYSDELTLLNKVDQSKLNNQVSFGAVVITDKQKMFISTALGKFIYNNESYYAISTQVPVYLAMKDKKAGDKFIFNNNTFTISEVF